MLKWSDSSLFVFNMILQKKQNSSPSDMKEENDDFNGVWMQTVLHLAENQGHKTNGNKLYMCVRHQEFLDFLKKW